MPPVLLKSEYIDVNIINCNTLKNNSFDLKYKKEIILAVVGHKGQEILSLIFTLKKWG